MKKLITTLAILVTLSGSLFANFFSNRIFEFKVNVPLGISNNTVGLFDIFTLNTDENPNKAIYQTESDGLVIDLTKLAETMPSSGFNTLITTNPTIDSKIRVKNVTVGNSLGVDVYMLAGFTKDLFNFIGTGNSDTTADDGSTTIKAGVNATLDVFAYDEINTTVKFKKKWTVTVAPAVFIPVVHAYSDNSVASLTNDAEGKVTAALNAKGIVYSVGSMDNFTNISTLPTELLTSIGVDLRGGVAYDLTKHFNAAVNFRFPIYPGHLRHTATYSIAYENSTSLTDIMSGGLNTSVTPEMSTGEWTDSNYYINRPLKFNVIGTLKPFGTVLTFTDGIGFGIRNPFSATLSEVKFYPEYVMGMKVSLFEILSLAVQTEYTNQIFAHSLGMSFNIRFTELDVGVSAQSSNFVSSCCGSGFGAYLTFVTGF